MQVRICSRKSTTKSSIYDVVDMKPTTFDIKKEESPTTATTQNAIGDINGAPRQRFYHKIPKSQ